MCIEVRVTYPRCFHVHLGHELCNELVSDYGYCPKFETHRRIEPFCPSCSKLEYRAHRMQSAMGLNARQRQETMIQTWTVMNSKQSIIVGQLQPQGRQDSGVGQQNFADNSKGGSLNSSVSDSSLNSKIQSLTPYFPLPLPIEPPIDPGLLGPHESQEYQQRLAMTVFSDYRPRFSQQDRRGS